MPQARREVKRRTFPASLRCAGIKILEVDGLSELGHFDHRDGVIRIRRDQPVAGKHVTLIHELLHVTESLLIQGGHLKRRVPHGFITGAAANLLGLLIDAGVYRGLTYGQLVRFVGAVKAR